MNTLDEIVARRKRQLKAVQALHQVAWKRPETLKDEACDRFFRPDTEWSHCIFILQSEEIYFTMVSTGIHLYWSVGSAVNERLFVAWENSMTHQEICFWAIYEAVRKKHGQE